MGEHAALWLRVSTKGQDEENQRPDNIKWCSDHGYDVKREYIVHGKSAYHGRHQKDLDAMFADMAAGVFTVLVVWRQDRIERRGMEYALNLISRARKAGGRIEFVKEPHLNQLNDMGGRIAYVIASEIANGSSETQGQRMIIEHDKLRNKGSWIGRPPWGYQIICDVCRTMPVRPKCNGHKKILVPTAEGRKWIPEIFLMMSEGKSRLAIARVLMDAGLKTMNGNTEWSEQGVAVIIENPVYMGQPRNNPFAVVEELVRPTVWQEANYAMHTRPTRPGRSTTKNPKALLKPTCPDCGSPMYRLPIKIHYYRCDSKNGSNPCAEPYMIPCADLDAAVTAAIMADNSPHLITEFVPGDDHSEEIARVQQQIAAAAGQKDFVRAAELSGEALRLSELPSAGPRYVTHVSGTTEAKYFDSLTLDEKRDYLAEYVIKPRRVRDAGSWRVEFTMVHRSLLASARPAQTC